MTANASTITFKSTISGGGGGTTPRDLGTRFADVVNVKDYGALGNNTGNDAPFIQAAIDAAFGTSGSPHGTSATLNRPLFFPNGTYPINTPLILTQVRGAHIYGSGMKSSYIKSSGAALVTNGMEYCNFEDLTFEGATGSVCADIDWNGVGSVGLKGNIFTNVNFGGGTYACRLGFSGNGGSNNHFFSCTFENTSVCGLTAYGAQAIGNTVQGGGASSNVTGYWAKSGQIASINDSGISGNTTQDVLVDSAFPILVKGCRTESDLFFKCNSTTGVAVLDGSSAAQSVNHFCHTKGKAIMDSCTTDSSNANTKLCNDATYTGKVYMRGCIFPQANFMVGFAGTIGQNI
jgi:hypothetical protein